MTGKADLFAIAGGTEARNGAEPSSRRTLPPAGAAPTIDLFIADSSRLTKWHDPQADRAVYLWGRVRDREKLAGDELLRFCADSVERNPAALRGLLGNFVLIIDNRRDGRVSFISDILAIRPWFVGACAGRLVAGSDVLALCHAGYTSGRINYDAVSSWLLYNFDCTGGSVAADYRRLPPATIWTFDASGRRLDEICYAPIRYSRKVVATEELVDELHAHMSRTFDDVLRDESDVSLPLSGGYDSRYLCALASRRGRPAVNAVTVATSPHELAPARQVADVLGLQLRVLGENRHVLDLFDDPVCFGGDGFALSRHLSAAVARLHPQMPLLSGFLGDVFMRAPVNPTIARWNALDDQELTDEQYLDACQRRFRVATNRLDLLQDAVARHAVDRTRPYVLQTIRGGRAAGRPMAFVNLMLRLRLYFGGVVLGHLDWAETLVPFVNWELINFSFSHVGSFRSENYAVLFARHLPELAHVPHDSHLKSDAAPSNGHLEPASRHLRPWSAQMLRGLLDFTEQTDTLIRPHKLLARLPAGLLADVRRQHEIMFLYKIHLFEKRLRESNLRLNWSEM